MVRLIYSLELDLGPMPAGGPTSRRYVIVNLDRTGRNLLKSCARPRRKERCVDLRVGDEILHNGVYATVHGIKSYRETMISDEAAESRTSREGWVVRASGSA